MKNFYGPVYIQVGTLLNLYGFLTIYCKHTRRIQSSRFPYPNFVGSKNSCVCTNYGPCIIGANTEVRHCAFIRGSALVGKNCVVGNSVELKNVILFDNVQTPHYNYVGDSILGYKSHMGAGSITSNVKSDKTLVCVNTPEGKIPTGLKKFGAMLGDHVEVGCNSVLNPGTVIGRNSSIYPLSCVRGYVAADSIYKENILEPTASAGKPM